MNDPMPVETRSAAVYVPESPSEHHELLRFVESLYREENALKRFTGGFSIAFRATRFLLGQRQLWANVAIPAAINLVLFFVTAGYALLKSGEVMDWLWTQPDGLLAILWWILYVIVTALLLVLSYFAVMILGSIVASPFNDMLSEETENILRGHVVKPEEEGLRGNAESILRSALFSVLIAVLYVGCMLPLFFMGLIPVVGSVVSTVLGGAVSAYFLAVEYSDYPLERRRYDFKDKFRLVWEHRKMTLGFGLGTSFLLWVPLLNFLCMPIAVIGGTAVGLSLDAAQKKTDPTPG